MLSNVTLASTISPSIGPLPHLGVEGLDKGRKWILTSALLNGELPYGKLCYSISSSLSRYYIMEYGRSHVPMGRTSGNDVDSRRVEQLEKKIAELRQKLKGKWDKQDLESMEKIIGYNIDNKFTNNNDELIERIQVLLVELAAASRAQREAKRIPMNSVGSGQSPLAYMHPLGEKYMDID